MLTRSCHVRSIAVSAVLVLLGVTAPVSAQYKPPPKKPSGEADKAPEAAPRKMPPSGPVYAPFPAEPIPGDVPEVVTAGLNENATGVSFAWKPGNPKPDPATYLAPPDFYRICVFDGADCKSSVRVQVFDQIDSTLRTHSPPEGLDYGLFQGRQFHWAIRACTSQWGCSGYSAARPMRWLLPAPESRGALALEQVQPDPDANPFMTYRFAWSRVTGAEYYYFCLYSGTTANCVRQDTMRTNDPFVRRRDNEFYVLDFNVPQFRGRTVRWTATACTSRLPVNEGCTVNQQGFGVAIDNPLQPPVLQPLKPILEDASSVTFHWDLPGAAEIHRVRICATDDFPGPDQARICEQWNRINDFERLPNPRSCTMRRPFYGGPDPDSDPAFSFAVAACNQFGRCWWSTLARVSLQGFEPYGTGPDCD